MSCLVSASRQISLFLLYNPEQDIFFELDRIGLERFLCHCACSGAADLNLGKYNGWSMPALLDYWAEEEIFMFMAMKYKLSFILLQTVVWFWLKNVCYGTESDLLCLQKLMQSLKDPENNIFYSWNLDNKSEGSICKYIGVQCWHPDESKVLNLHLSNMGLVGQFPSGLENCTSLTGLDLSNNNLSGLIPANISKRIPFVTSLDLSFNGFSGSIPVNLSNCGYLNSLKLQHNQLTGNIPAQLSSLDRLQTFDVSDNQLTGNIPKTIGGMKSLETLDLSFNNLSGAIPQGLTMLSSLSHLNLSYNNLSGTIPTGNQLQTLQDGSIYIGNPHLCGAPTINSCFPINNNDVSCFPINNNDVMDKAASNPMSNYLPITLRFLVGIWSVFVIILFKKDWRHFYFGVIDRVYDKAYAVIKVRMKRK